MFLALSLRALKQPVTFRMIQQSDLTYFQKAMDFIEASKSAQDLEDLRISFLKVIREFGFEYFACVSSVDFGDRPEGAVFLENYPKDWSSYYIQHNLEKTDPIQQLSVNQHMPFNWDDKRIHHKISEKQIDVMADAADAGLVYGVTVPIHVVGALPGAVTVVGETRAVDPAVEHALHLMGVYLHDAALRLEKPRSAGFKGHGQLTPREKECLKWAAAGKTDWEIAAILSIAERTAHTHIEHAKRKLGVNTRVQAVVKAFLTNLMPF